MFTSRHRWPNYNNYSNNYYYTVRSDDEKVLKSRWNFVKTKTTTPGNDIYTLLITFITFTSFISPKFQTLYFPYKLSYYAWANCGLGSSNTLATCNLSWVDWKLIAHENPFGITFNIAVVLIAISSNAWAVPNSQIYTLITAYYWRVQTRPESSRTVSEP